LELDTYEKEILEVQVRRGSGHRVSATTPIQIGPNRKPAAKTGDLTILGPVNHLAARRFEHEAIHESGLIAFGQRELSAVQVFAQGEDHVIDMEIDVHYAR
jgi:hypothetical protein